MHATLPKFVVVKQITSKTVCNDLVLQNCFQSLLSDDQEVYASCPTILTIDIVESTTNIFLK